jgi:CHASE2 domain-containing sensor protein
MYALFGAGLKSLEERFGALGWTFNPDQELEQRVLLIGIDERSIAEIGAWPWPRSEMARLVNALNDYDVQLQLHDIVYSEPNFSDDALIGALDRSRGAIIAQFPPLQSTQQLEAGELTHPVYGVSCNADLAATDSFIAPHSGFRDIPKGHITAIISPDGAIRKVPALVCVGAQAYPALALTALLHSVGSDRWSVMLSEQSSFFGSPKVLELGGYPGLRIPLDKNGNLRISYRRAPETYSVISALDVMKGTADRELLANSWVVVGATAFGIGDIVPTPYSGATPGVELQARILTSLLDSKIPYTPAGAYWMLLAFSIIAGALLLIVAGAREKVSLYGLPLAGLLLPLVAFGLHILLLAKMQIWLGFIFPAVFSLCAVSMLLLLEQGVLRSERSRVFANLNSFLPGDVAKEIAYNLPSSNINAKRKDVTLLCADLRNFAVFGEARPPEESAAILHFFLVKASELTQKYGGRIQEFRGDGILAVWDGQDSETARSALNAAQEMQEIITPCLLTQDLPEWLAPLALGIGIEQGPVLTGLIGPANRRAHTLLGDTVTITLRIQEMTAELAQPILIGECAARQLSKIGLESQGSYLLSGLRLPHLLFAPPFKEMPSNKRASARKLRIIKGGLG